MSDECWDLVLASKEELITSINQAADALPEKSSSLDLAKKVFEVWIAREVDPIQVANRQLKNEIRQVF